MADMNLQDRTLSSGYSPNASHFDNEFSSYFDHKDSNDSQNGPVLKLVFGEIYNDWEKHRGICCLTQPQFAKHLLGIHEKFCQSYLYNSNSSTLGNDVPNPQSNDFQEINNLCGIVESDASHSERNAEEVKLYSTSTDIGIGPTAITTICLPDWQSTSTTALIDPKHISIDNKVSGAELNDSSITESKAEKNTSSAMCQTSDNEDEDKSNDVYDHLEADNKRFIKFMSKRNKKKDGSDVVVTRVKRKYVRKTPVPPKKVYKCEFCEKEFNAPSSLKSHSLRHTGEKPYICKACKKCFRTSAALNRHSLVHTGERPHLCTQCGMSYKDLISLQTHKKTHTGEKSYCCPVCGKSFALSSYLYKHLVVHTGEKPHLCTTCGKRFADPSNLQTHTKLHTNDRRHKCNTCGKLFIKGSHLTSHMRVHTGEKPYLCQTCGKTFTQPCHLQVHVRSHTGEKPHVCVHCNKRFSDSSKLRRHNKTHRQGLSGVVPTPVAQVEHTLAPNNLPPMQTLTAQQVIDQQAAAVQQHHEDQQQQQQHQQQHQNTIGHLLQAQATPENPAGTHVLIQHTINGQTNTGGQTQTILHLPAEALAQMGMTPVAVAQNSLQGGEQLTVVPMSRIGSTGEMTLPLGMVGMTNITNIPRDMTTFMNL